MLEKNAPRLERDINYAGAVRSAESYKKKKRERGSFFQRPAMQVAGAFLAAAIVGGGTFGALKYLEYRGASVTSVPGGKSDTQNSSENSDVTDKASLYDYEDVLAENKKVRYGDNYDRFAVILTGGNLYYPKGEFYSVKIKADNGYSYDSNGSDAFYPPVIDFGGDLQILNNVEDREMKILYMVVAKADNLNDKKTFKSADEAAKYLKSIKEDGKYVFYATVTWDDEELEEIGDKYTIYKVGITFYVPYVENTGESTYVKGRDSVNNRYLAVRSGGNVYYPSNELQSFTKHLATGQTEHSNYDRTMTPPIIEVPYGDDFSVENNVEDRKLTVISIRIYESLSSVTPIAFTRLSDLYGYLKNAADGKYYVEIYATWDDLNDDFYTYNVPFTVVKKNAASFGNVTVINFYNPQNLSRDSIVNLKPYAESVKIALPIENDHTTVYHIVSDEADALGFEIYLYNNQSDKAPFALETGLCVLDRDGKLVMNFEPGFIRFAPIYLIYAGDTPSNHPMFFFTSIKTLSGPDWYYTAVFAFDITTKKVTMLGITGPKAYGSDSFYTSGNLQYNEESKEIQYVVDEIQRSGTPDKATTGRTFIFADRIIWDGEKYVLENLPYPEQGGKITDGDDYDPTGWLRVQAGTDYCYPTIIYKKVIDGTNVSGFNYNDKICEIKYNSSNEINIGNTVRRGWRIYSVTVDYKNEFTTFEDAIKYAREITENTDHTAYVEAVITWNTEAICKDDVSRTEYTFAFNLSFEETEDKTPAPGDWVTINIGTDAFYPAATKKTELRNDGLNEITEYPAEIPMFDWEIKDDISFTVQRDGTWQMLNIKVNDEVYFTSFASAMKHISGLYGTTHVEFALLFDDIEGALYTYAFDLFVTDKSETTTPAPDIEVNTENPAEVFDTWLRSKLFAGMRFEDLRKTVWKIDVGGYTIGTEYAAGNYKQVNYESDGSFFRYGNDVYDWTFYTDNDNVGEKEGGTIREVRLILRKGYGNFYLPCGITLDMAPYEALIQMGFTEEQIKALEGKTARNGNFEITYYPNSLLISYLINENGYVVDMGINLTASGSECEVYLEMERQ